MRYAVLAGLFAVLVPGLGAEGSPEKGALQPPAAPDMKQMQEQMKAMQEKQLEMMKKVDPKGYQAQKAAMDRQEQIDKIVASARSGKLADAQAQQQLYPLLKQGLQPELEHVDDRIAALEKRLAFWKQVKKDPDVMIRQRVEEALGKRRPEPPMGVW